ncbi:scarecrow-like protein 14 [Rhodamnia argentea]|uniref:Scarecrow-like protein 14 n=1 Tax=Rhodamnia argentea TaxID=178133 RepID=A0A8B8PRK3_9MYRT|nr:scarecrow-like protein 14 [Rhodamnia argentea]XP_030537412.1 scarecrow-like protein 14 [Rhodamnia argentea]
MFMDPQYTGYSGPFSGFNFHDQSLVPFSNPFEELANQLMQDDPSTDLSVDCPSFASDPEPSNYAVSPSFSTDGDIPSDYSDSPDPMFKYISQMLMEEEMDDKPCMFHDPLALQAAEKSLYDVLCQKDRPSQNQLPLYMDSPDDNCSGSSSSGHSGSTISSSASSGGNLVDFPGIGDFCESRPSILQSHIPENFVFQATANPSRQSSHEFRKNVIAKAKGMLGPGSAMGELLLPNLFADSNSMFFFQKGFEEASRFIPKGNPLSIDTEKSMPHLVSKRETARDAVKVEKHEAELSFLYEPKGKKKHEREDADFEYQRSTKQPAVCFEENELAEMFDRVLLCAPTGRKTDSKFDDASSNGASQSVQQNLQSSALSAAQISGKKPISDKKEVVDLRNLLCSCAQAVAVEDRKNANQYLEQIRQHSFAHGDGSQRLAHYFAEALQARMDCTGVQIYTKLGSKRKSANEMLKAYQAYLSVFPFQRFAIIYSNHMILSISEKATKLHIIDFGILYGFQWPALIHCLARRPGGPPKLRVTGIELPQSGFRPAERVQETGRRLAKYCERFNVPFQYNAIAQKWETIRIEDLKISNDEVVAVNCLFRFKNLLDETVIVNSPRDHVLKLVHRIRPRIFVHSILNGSFNACFFVSRFREVLFHYSALFDAFDAKLPREHPLRQSFELEFFSREALNVIACEGTERVERPETYKQWQIRSMRAGFKPLPLDPEIMKKLKSKLKEGYLDDFVVDRDGPWMLQGWKGRILYASSCWEPV